MTTPTPPLPSIKDVAATPQGSPTTWGAGQAALTTFLFFKGLTAMGMSPEYAVIVGGSVASGITSALHALAQRWHLNGEVYK